MKTDHTKQIGQKRVRMARFATAGLTMISLWLASYWLCTDQGNSDGKATDNTVQPEAAEQATADNAPIPSPVAGPQIPPERLQAFRQAIAAKGLTVMDPLLRNERSARVEHKVGNPQAGSHAAVPRPLHSRDAFDFKSGVTAHGVAQVTAANPRHGMQLEFDSAGLRVSPSAKPSVDPISGGGAGSDWALTMRVQGVRRGQAGQEFAPVAPEGNGPRVEYRRPVVTEWYANDMRGLEQGFTVTSKPLATTGGGSAEPLRIELTVETALQAMPSADTRSLHFKDSRDNIILRYGALQAFDANGRPLPAEFEFAAPSAGRPMQVALKVNDRDAVYPVTIDPLLTAELFMDLNTTTDSSIPYPYLDYTGTWAAVGGVAYFAANDHIHGVEFWRSDGTPEGTWMVKDIRSGPEGCWSYPYTGSFRTWNGRVYFEVMPGTVDAEQQELWQSEGDAASTHIVTTSPQVPVQSIVAGVGKYLVVRVAPNTAGYPQQVGVLDTTSGVIKALHVFAPCENNPSDIYWTISSGVAAGNRLYHTRGTAALWVTDFLTGVTRRVKDFVSVPSLLLGHQGNVYFSVAAANNQIEHWVSDGSPENTVRLAFPSGAYAYQLGAAGDWVYYSFRNSLQNEYDLWRYCPAGRVELFKSIGLHPTSFVGLTDGRFYLVTENQANWLLDLWFSDGTPSGTQPIKVGILVSSPTLVGNRLFFVRYGSYHYEGELWTSDGTADGTISVKALNHDNYSFLHAS